MLQVWVESDHKCEQGLNGRMINPLSIHMQMQPKYDHVMVTGEVGGTGGRYCEQRRRAVHTPIGTAM